MVVGTVLATLRMSGNRWAKGLDAAYVKVHQNVPMLVQISL